MHPVRAILLSLSFCLAASAEDGSFAPDEVVGSVRIWMQENVEDWVFDAAGIDRDAVDQSLTIVQEELHASLPANAGPQRENIDQMLLLLDEFEQTKPYSLWLRSFLDQQLKTTPPTNAIKASPTRPDSQELRSLWLTIITNRPAPAKASDFIPQIKPIFRSESVPAELVWVAEVESAFDPHAKSPVGAVGLFQLMPETAKSLGLSTWLPDERRNAKKNARAAAKYLQYLHERFGDWRLALAAYNAGPTRVARLLRTSEAYSYDAIAHRLPSETRDYVAKVEATLLIREGVALASLSSERG